MPVQACESDGKPGYRWGERGHCYTYTPGDEDERERARALAERQGRAIQAQENNASEESSMERKSLNLEIKDVDKGLVTAVFTTFRVVDKDGDWTLPDAFEDGARVKISAYGHSSWAGALPVGRGKIVVTAEHALLEGKFFLSTTAGRETYATVKEMGELQEWSYGFDVIKALPPSEEQKQAGARRVLAKVRVHEVSPVLIGAGVNTRTLSLKARNLTISVDVIERWCPPCAAKMRELGWTELKLAWLLDRKQMPPQLLEGLCNAIGGDPGFFTACMERDFGDFDPDKEAFCAWLHHECTGLYPGEHRSAALRELARFERTRARLMGAL